MRALEILRGNLDQLMKSRGWRGNKRIVEATAGRLSNGTLGRIRSTEDDCKLSQIEELANVFNVSVADLVSPQAMARSGTATMSAGEVLLAVAKALEGEDTFKRKAIASIVSDMLVSGERESAASAIDAVATVVVSVPAKVGDTQPEAPPIRANDVDQHHNLVETVSSTSNESITVTTAPSHVTGTKPGAVKEMDRWEKLGTPVDGSVEDVRPNRGGWTTDPEPKGRGKGRKK